MDPATVEVAALGDVVSGPRVVVDRDSLDRVVFLYCVKGRASILLSDREEAHCLKDGDIIVIFPGRILSVTLEAAENRFMFVTLRGKGIVSAALHLGYWDQMRFNEPLTGDFMSDLVARFNGSPLGGRDPEVIDMMEHLLRNVWQRQCDRGGQLAFYRAVQKINRMPLASFTTENAAKSLGVSRTQLNELFAKAGYGRPGRYMAAVRQWIVKEMLVDTQLSVDEIARKAGFSGASALTYSFRKQTGRTPAEFRKKPFCR